MQSRRDHVHAYQFATGRLAAALVTGEPAPGDPPARRSVVGAVIGVVLALLVCAGFAVYGLIKPGGNTSWAKQGTIVVEKDTGSRFLYLNGVLHPVANYASALLGASAAGGDTGVRSVSRNSLSGVRRGAEIGIAGGPDSVPRASALLTGPWARCLAPGRGTGETIDFAPDGKQPSGAAATDRRILLRDEAGTDYVLWNGTRYRLGGRSALVTLELDGQEPVQAPQSWLTALPDGPTVAAASVPDRGEPGPRIAGRESKVGQVFTTAADGAATAQYYVLRTDGLAPLNHTEYALMATDAKGLAPRHVSQADIAAAPGSEDRSLLHRLPDFLSGPVAQLDRRTVCLRQSVTGTKTHTTVSLQAKPTAAVGRVSLPVGAGLLLQPLPLPRQGESRRLFLVTELGVKYPLGDDSALSALGYADSQVRVAPPEVLDLLATGPVLSGQGALTPVPMPRPTPPAPSGTPSGGG
ncbi:type VII secretion protein EccB [Streptomyces viridiviolaceus]|uniref:Type VII secretion protein EccB n=1 Tax=Streptomyces viridiviolaceus TaxID=68282 RepID=A0ABW2EBL5_9ACTN|nr:type VII secretion protein EccB [Streptomyces viridiviolaceus]GHB68394.1 type VII secretion protein EccB [Streptomyces viridiviolaceus]